MGDQRTGAASAIEFGSDATVTRSLVGLMSARDVHLTDAVAGFVAAKGNLSILNGGSGPVIARGGVTIRYGGCGPVIAGGDISIENGGAQGIIAAGGATIGPKAFVGFVAAPKVTVQEGGKVLFGTRQALAFGAIAGAAFAIVRQLIRRSSPSFGPNPS